MITFSVSGSSTVRLGAKHAHQPASQSDRQTGKHQASNWQLKGIDMLPVWLNRSSDGLRCLSYKLIEFFAKPLVVGILLLSIYCGDI